MIIETTDTAEIAIILHNVNSVSDTHCTSADVIDSGYLLDANLETKQLIPNYDSIISAAGDNFERLKSVVRKKTIIKLLQSVKREESRTIDDLTQKYSIVKISDIVAQYEAEIEDIVFKLSDGESVVSGSWRVVAGVI